MKNSSKFCNIKTINTKIINESYRNHDTETSFKIMKACKESFHKQKQKNKRKLLKS